MPYVTAQEGRLVVRATAHTAAAQQVPLPVRAFSCEPRRPDNQDQSPSDEATERRSDEGDAAQALRQSGQAIRQSGTETRSANTPSVGEGNASVGQAFLPAGIAADLSDGQECPPHQDDVLAHALIQTLPAYRERGQTNHADAPPHYLSDLRSPPSLLSRSVASSFLPFTTGLPAWDALAPYGRFVRGAVHELLHAADHPPPQTAALALALAAARRDVDGDTERTQRPASVAGLTDFGVPNSVASDAPIAWIDPTGTLHPPGLAALGLDLNRLYLVRVNNPKDVLWAACECLKCPGLAAVVCPVGRLTRVEARRLQLAAEQAGTVGLLVREMGQRQSTEAMKRRSDEGRQASSGVEGRSSSSSLRRCVASSLPSIYAAATRWIITPARGERRVQRWRIRLAHGHGGPVDSTCLLEAHRDALIHRLRATPELADRSAEAPSVARRA